MTDQGVPPPSRLPLPCSLPRRRRFSFPPLPTLDLPRGQEARQRVWVRLLGGRRAGGGGRLAQAANLFFAAPHRALTHPLSFPPPSSFVLQVHRGASGCGGGGYRGRGSSSGGTSGAGSPGGRRRRRARGQQCRRGGDCGSRGQEGQVIVLPPQAPFRLFCFQLLGLQPVLVETLRTSERAGAVGRGWQGAQVSAVTVLIRLSPQVLCAHFDGGGTTESLLPPAAAASFGWLAPWASQHAARRQVVAVSQACPPALRFSYISTITPFRPAAVQQPAARHAQPLPITRFAGRHGDGVCAEPSGAHGTRHCVGEPAEQGVERR